MKVSACTRRPVLVPCSLENLDYQIDPYVGCGHLCHYCYVLNQAETDWTKEVLIHEDILGQLGEELAKIPRQPIYMGYYTDPYQPCEAEYGQTRKVLELLLEKKHSARILTKSDLVLRDMDLLREMDQASVSVSVAFTDNRILQKFEANTIDTGERIRAIGKLRKAGIRTSALICPVIPYLSDVLPLVEMLAPCTDVIWIYRLSIREPGDRNWRNVQRILDDHFPDNRERIETVILSEEHPYWNHLRKELTALKEERQLDLRIHL